MNVHIREQEREQDKDAQEQTQSIQTLSQLDNIISNRYISGLSNARIRPLSEELQERRVEESACLFPIQRIVYDRQENNLQKLVNMYIGASSIDASMVMILHHPEVEQGVEMYMGVFDEPNRDDATAKAEIILHNLKGNFPGCQVGSNDALLDNERMTNLMAACLSEDNYHALSCVSGVGSLRGGAQKKEDNSAFLQGIEKLMDGMENRTYSVIILASAISEDMIVEMQSEYETLYHSLSPYAKISDSMSRSSASSLSRTISESASRSLSHSRSTTLSVGKSRSESSSKGGSESTSDQTGGTIGVSEESGVSVFAGPFSVNKSIGVHADISRSHSRSRGTNWSKTASFGESETSSSGESDTDTDSFSFSVAEGNSVSLSLGRSRQLTYENKTVLELLSNIDRKLQRLNVGRGQGMFAVSAYFVAPSLHGVKSAAAIYKSLIMGDDSPVESASVNAWGQQEYLQLKPYLLRLMHPVFLLENQEEVTAASIVTSSELAIHMGLPKHSVSGIPVSSSVSFGRNVYHVSRTEEPTGSGLPVGNNYHLGTKMQSDVRIDYNSLAMHSLLCGTTGVGKSNAAYHILRNLPSGVHYLVIEPAKGEYKDAIGNCAAVYGTNPFLTPMLRINPFRFCQFTPEGSSGKGVHLLEHLDRLSMVFNACWPMEAAMPAVLKSALEQAYVAAGWNLERSENHCSNLLFPTFEDVMRQVRVVVEKSDYSEENKGNYIGALCTRLQELATGLNGMIFRADDLTDTDLFDQNVIVDLSRLGSPETKALIMGLLLIRLQEYRQCTACGANAPFRHLTVLEEAHHLLRRTSMEQSTDRANLMGRSVEMLSNAFAEMRTYGEGFLIIDQSPAQLDMSVIRNTNTKFVMRLPEYEDRKLLGRATGLNEEQIFELARLPDGIAAVYQNNWLEAVLVKMPKATVAEEPFIYHDFEEDRVFGRRKEDDLYEALLACDPLPLRFWLKELGNHPLPTIATLQLPTQLKRTLIDYYISAGIDSPEEQQTDMLSAVFYTFYHAEDAFHEAQLSKNEDDLERFKQIVLDNLQPTPRGDAPIDRLFAMLSIERQRRFGHTEWLISRILDEADNPSRIDSP